MSWDKLKRTATSSSLEASVGAHVHMRVEDFVNLASRTSELFDMLLRTVLKFQFLSNDNEVDDARRTPRSTAPPRRAP
ncbi:hypothetical protein PF010_g2199 [Phytophthora fragariae]|uniref:Uncharacterized protein n=1 Tax=Phytophthora fragariae TaxID=53985 RepID=A0A6A3UQK4_9STRA|nr:hypothetical protein PF009_g3008 [Phytophthora fragariae]KAE9134813.1 hypothetical protein PF007_g2777 [Phytophthora fragariae]KAE9135109.1 hypothetical protein PF010_g2199 [Phytophthora fragariae]KAE9153528.1 hypothetical protein PF006_g2341 [Phytophthora fragariae]KAE9251992.1 hypothetical protein PF004_g2177 [Phytophthora fragariae]